MTVKTVVCREASCHLYPRPTRAHKGVWVGLTAPRPASAVLLNKDKGVCVRVNQRAGMHTVIFSIHVCRFDEDINQSCHSCQLTSGSEHPLGYMIASVIESDQAPARPPFLVSRSLMVRAFIIVAFFLIVICSVHELEKVKRLPLPA